MRVMQEIKISTDDSIPIYISYPSEMSPDELKDLEDVVAIWIRQLRRHVGEAERLLAERGEKI